MRNRLIPRVFSAALTAVYFATNCAFAQQASMLAILPFGSVRKLPIALAEGDKLPTIIHIQDVHGNTEAQKNIGAAVGALLKSGHVGFVALEGASGPIGLTAFQTFPHKPTVKKAADYLLRTNKISGAIHAALTSNSEFRVVGVDDPVHYQANIDAYLAAAPLIERNKKELDAQRRRLNALKKKVFNADLFSFDQRVSAYRAGTWSLAEYLRFLPTSCSGREVAYGDSPSSLDNFLEATHLETTLDFTRVEQERSRLFSRLLSKLNKNQSDELASFAAAYRVGTLRHADFYDHLNQVCERNNIVLSDFPSLQNYFRYVRISDRIDAEELLNDVRALEQQAYDSLIKTSDERRLVAEAKGLYLKGKLLDFALTKEEWKEYVRHGEELRPFEQFYEQAEIRDQKIAENLLSEINHPSKIGNRKSVILVTGGFHSSGIDKKLTAAGYNVVAFTPKISKIDDSAGSTYLNAFAQEKTPLEKLFEGKKLFLTRPPYSDSAGQTARAIVLAEAYRVGSGWLGIARRMFHAPALFVAKAGEFAIRVSNRQSALEVQYDEQFNVKDILVTKGPFAVGAVAFVLSALDHLAPRTGWRWLRMSVLKDEEFGRLLDIPVPSYRPLVPPVQSLKGQGAFLFILPLAFEDALFPVDVLWSIFRWMFEDTFNLGFSVVLMFLVIGMAQPAWVNGIPKWFGGGLKPPLHMIVHAVVARWNMFHGTRDVQSFVKKAEQKFSGSYTVNFPDLRSTKSGLFYSALAGLRARYKALGEPIPFHELSHYLDPVNFFNSIEKALADPDLAALARRDDLFRQDIETLRTVMNTFAPLVRDRGQNKGEALKVLLVAHYYREQGWPPPSRDVLWRELRSQHTDNAIRMVSRIGLFKPTERWAEQVHPLFDSAFEAEQHRRHSGKKKFAFADFLALMEYRQKPWGWQWAEEMLSSRRYAQSLREAMVFPWFRTFVMSIEKELQKHKKSQDTFNFLPPIPLAGGFAVLSAQASSFPMVSFVFFGGVMVMAGFFLIKIFHAWYNDRRSAGQALDTAPVKLSSPAPHFSEAAPLGVDQAFTGPRVPERVRRIMEAASSAMRPQRPDFGADRVGRISTGRSL